MMNFKIRFFQTFGISVIVMVFAGMLIFSNCSGDEPTGPQNPQIVEVAISPKNAELEVGEELEFSAFALTAAGDTVDISDLDIEWQWWSDDPDVFTVEPGGFATAQSPGEAYCIVEATIEVGLNLNQKDVSFAGFGFISKRQNRIPIDNLELSLEDRVISGFNNISFKKSMRFTGRDSAFVMVF